MIWLLMVGCMGKVKLIHKKKIKKIKNNISQKIIIFFSKNIFSINNIFKKHNIFKK